MKPIKFQKALDSNDNIVDISEIDESRKEETFTCIGCGGRIYPRLGKNRIHHFYHKEGECSSESYLHQLAKLKIKMHFDSDKPLWMRIPVKHVCSCLQECKYSDPNNCIREYSSHGPILEGYNLQDFYDECLVEENVDNFVGDIVLRHSKTGRVLLIEIVVTHSCEQEKWNSGHKIIETRPIKSEKQIIDLMNNWFSPSNCRFSPGFKVPTITKKLVSNHMSRFMYFAKSGKAHIPSPFPTGDTEYDTKFDIDCEHLHIRKNQYSTTELNVVGDYLGYPSTYQLGLLYMHIHYGVKHCSICKYYSPDDQYCHLSRKYHTPAYTNGPEAKQCQYFRTIDYDRKLIDEKVEEV